MRAYADASSFRNDTSCLAHVTRKYSNNWKWSTKIHLVL